MFTFDEIKSRAVPIAIKHGVDSISLFGSYARNEQKEDSDIDFLIDKGKITGFLSYFALVNDLEENFKTHVDLLTTDADDKNFIKKIQNEAKVLYVRK